MDGKISESDATPIAEAPNMPAMLVSEETTPIIAQPVPVSSPALQPPEMIRDRGTDPTSHLTTYIVVMLSSLAMLAGASYLFWRALSHFVLGGDSLLFFDLSSFDMYVLIYTLLFGTTYLLGVSRLEKSFAASDFDVKNPYKVLSSVYQAVLTVTFIGGVVGLIYAPLSGVDSGYDGENIAVSIGIDVAVSIFTIGMSSLLLWRDKLLMSARSGVVPLAAIGVVLVLLLVAMTISIVNPSEPDPADDMYDSVYQDDTE